jgi:hypothetical protein
MNVRDLENRVRLIRFIEKPRNENYRMKVLLQHLPLISPNRQIHPTILALLARNTRKNLDVEDLSVCYLSFGCLITEAADRISTNIFWGPTVIVPITVAERSKA